ncbi:MAG: GNAT family N-acetyltransferase [Cyanobacteria bacterium P01_A01_bin.3]
MGTEPPGPTFRIASTFDDLLKVMSVRSIVFIHEQNCPYAIEVDGQDHAAIHILGEQDGEPIAAGRIRFFHPYAKLERLAIRQQFRGRGYGQQLLAFMMATIRDRGFERMKLHAQVQATEFYRRQGFATRGEVFVEADIDHLLMVYEPAGTLEE